AVECLRLDRGELLDKQSGAYGAIAQQATFCSEKKALEQEIVVSAQECDRMVRGANDVASQTETLGIEGGILQTDHLGQTQHSGECLRWVVDSAEDRAELKHDQRQIGRLGDGGVVVHHDAFVERLV